MRYLVLFIVLFMTLPVLAQNVPVPQTVTQDKGALISDIRMEGFVLGDKDQFVKLFKPYRNKYLKTSDMDEILKKIERIYEEDGYQELVSITYQVKKRRLTFTALMTS